MRLSLPQEAKRWARRFTCLVEARRFYAVSARSMRSGKSYSVAVITSYPFSPRIADGRKPMLKSSQALNDETGEWGGAEDITCDGIKLSQDCVLSTDQLSSDE